MLLRPLRFSNEADEQVGFLLDVVSVAIDVSSTGLHLVPPVGRARSRVVYLHRERKPTIQVMEGRGVWLATGFQQDVGFRHFV